MVLIHGNQPYALIPALPPSQGRPIDLIVNGVEMPGTVTIWGKHRKTYFVWANTVLAVAAELPDGAEVSFEVPENFGRKSLPKPRKSYFKAARYEEQLEEARKQQAAGFDVPLPHPPTREALQVRKRSNDLIDRVKQHQLEMKAAEMVANTRVMWSVLTPA